MSDKITYKIEDIIIEISMGPFGSDIKTDCFTDSGVPLLDGSNITRFKLVEDKFKFVSVEKSNQLKKANAKRGDVVVTHRGTLGQISYIPEDSKYDKYLISQSQFRVCFKDEIVNPVYMVYYFHTKEGQKKLLSFASYVGVPALAQATSNFRLLEVSLPDLSEQERIISFLDVIEQKIDLNTKINYELESLAKTIYDYWFLQFEFPDANGKPYKSSGGRMVWNNELKKEVPEGWTYIELQDISEITAGGDRPTNISSKISPEFSIPVVSNSIENEGICGFTTSASKPEWSVTVAARGTIGYAILRTEKYVPIIRLISIIPFNKIYSKYIEEYINSISFSKNGSIQQQLPVPQISVIKILKPSELIMKKYWKIVTYTIQYSEKLKKENRELASLRDFLLPLLMNGQVTFKDEKECAA
ncbi:MAG: restriction endonuclease subunit S [Candidatus Cloacimonetes bacterium]|jgi:type I restriction enzyme S subunit|nr:restriction endonuclease subunit S [Candidatus Cloacimonadota bacterium]MDY3202593.1 restriction endonuclease subunit S [Methanocorpusculum sp.]